MSVKTIKILISLLIIGGALGLLLYSTTGNAFEYYKHVDEVATTRGDWQKKPLQLHGFVVPGSIKKRLGERLLEYKFQATNCGQAVDVYYAGTVPDTFKDGAEVVVKGRFDGNDFRSTEVMAKCPSKYQATSGAQSMCTRGKAN